MLDFKLSAMLGMAVYTVIGPACSLPSLVGMQHDVSVVRPVLVRPIIAVFIVVPPVVMKTLVLAAIRSLPFLLV
jgi:hypothetical protein